MVRLKRSGLEVAYENQREEVLPMLLPTKMVLGLGDALGVIVEGSVRVDEAVAWLRKLRWRWIYQRAAHRDGSKANVLLNKAVGAR
ncbi:hypothetical protein PG994_015174 [Apiospora phragmitis]|uniref:Uncharacterized protein n=1 Tax=Apiospora phragmitis TaxID=2905665 RepID=A0ABR1SW26_9PEZI